MSFFVERQHPKGSTHETGVSQSLELPQSGSRLCVGQFPVEAAEPVRGEMREKPALVLVAADGHSGGFGLFNQPGKIDLSSQITLPQIGKNVAIHLMRSVATKGTFGAGIGKKFVRIQSVIGDTNRPHKPRTADFPLQFCLDGQRRMG